MSVAYSPLNQGQGTNDRSNQPASGHSSAAAPMARAEIDDMEEERKNGDPAPGANNIPHIVVTEPHGEKALDPEDRNYDPDDLDGRLKDGEDHAGDLRPNAAHSLSGRVPHLGLNFDTELGSIAGETIPDINVYQHKKTLAQGMMDLALFSANANQLRYVLDSYSRHPYYWPSVVCICLSLGLQIGVGIGLIWNALYDVKADSDLHIANRINNFTVIGIFLVVVLNVFISVFAIDSHDAAHLSPSPSPSS